MRERLANNIHFLYKWRYYDTEYLSFIRKEILVALSIMVKRTI